MTKKKNLILSVAVLLAIILMLLSSFIPKKIKDLVPGDPAIEPPAKTLYNHITCVHNGDTYSAVALGRQDISNFFTYEVKAYSWDTFKRTDKTIDITYYEQDLTTVKNIETGIYYEPNKIIEEYILVETKGLFALFELSSKT